MKVTLKNIVIALLFCAFNTVWSQDITDSNYQEALSENLRVLSQINASESARIVNGNNVFIQQIGQHNYVDTYLKADNAQLNIRQEGGFNSVEIQEVSKNIYKDINQIGFDNEIKDTSFNPTQNTQLELNQIGDNLSFERIGTNELTKNLKFTMTGANKSIIVRSF